MSTSSPWSARALRASVAPLGTALTENQLALLWKMADEPILCFDGDKAGQKAAWRAADLALPHLAPGKSLRFALLPEGQDPDDLARSGGRGAIEEVISAARGLADVIWSREIEGGSFATPERRAALEARIGELTNGIRDEVVRRYYRQDLAERLQRTFAPEAARGGYARGGYRGGAGNFGGESGRRFAPRGVHAGAAGRFASRGGRGAWAAAGSQTINRGPYQAASPQLGAEPDHARPAQRDVPPRGADSAVPDQSSLAAARPSGRGGGAGIGPSRGQQTARRHHRGLRQRPSPQPGAGRAEPRKCGPTSRRADFRKYFKGLSGRSRPGRCGARKPGAAREDVLSTWHQLVSLHRQWHSLLRELKDAELALGEEASEANLAWLRDVKARLAEVDGTEALIEGFGESVGPVPAQRLIKKCCGRRPPEPRKDSPNPWFGCKNRVNRSLIAFRLIVRNPASRFGGGEGLRRPFRVITRR